MIRIVLVVVLYFVSQITLGQSKFEQGMEQAFTLMNENKLEEAGNLLERIANAEQENWLPPYHLALLKARTSFSMKDKKLQEAQIKAAEAFIEKAEDLSPNNSEVYVVKAMVNVAKIASNPMVYGASLSEPTSKLYKKAIALDKTNPRAHSGLVEFEMGGARFFGQDLAPYCKRLQETIAKYDAFKPAGKFYPAWGKAWTLQVLEGCDGNKKETTSPSTVETSTSGNLSISVTVPNVSNSKGKVLIALYNSQDNFNKRQALASKEAEIVDGKASVVFENIAPGDYAVVCLHDENLNGNMDFDDGGMPLEDYGSSNNPMQMGPPNFADAKFTVENKSLDLSIRF